MILSLLTLLPLAGAVLVAMTGRAGGRFVRPLALGVHGVAFLLALGLGRAFDAGAGGMQFVERRSWVPSLGAEYHVGIDGLGLVGVWLATGVPFLAALVSERTAQGRESLYYGLLLVLECGLMGTFTALNFFHWFLFWEVSLVPAYLLVRLFGGSRAGAASFQFFVYTMVGSVGLLLGFLALRAAGGSFDFQELAEFGQSGRLARTLGSQIPWVSEGGTGAGEILAWLVFLGVMLGFAVKVPLWPFHTWLPDTYAEAPSPVTMVLTGAMSKMGVYGLLRIALPIFPDQFRAAQGWLLVLALATVVLPAMTAFAQGDLKRMLAFSSVNHLGYCLVGLFVLTPGASGSTWVNGVAAPALNGVMLQMLNHGLTAATIFALVEFLERRTGGQRDLGRFGGLRRAAPVYCGLLGISLFASLGMPGLNGFISEFLIFKGVLAAVPWAAGVAALGLLATAVFLLVAMRRMFHGPLRPEWQAFWDLGVRERVQLAVPVGLMLVLGVYPGLVLELINPTSLRLAGGGY